MCQLTLVWRWNITPTIFLCFFGYAKMTLNWCMQESKKKLVFDWPNLSSVVLDGTNLTHEEAFASEDIDFQLQQWEPLLLWCWLMKTMPSHPIPESNSHVSPSPNAHPNTRFSKAVSCNMAPPLLEHTIKWESASHMDKYNVVGVIAIPYLGYECIITIVPKEDKTCLFSKIKTTMKCFPFQ